MNKILGQVNLSGRTTIFFLWPLVVIPYIPQSVITLKTLTGELIFLL